MFDDGFNYKLFGYKWPSIRLPFLNPYYCGLIFGSQFTHNDCKYFRLTGSTYKAFAPRDLYEFIFTYRVRVLFKFVF